jgi:flavin reductase (DIM6/NTAB) family NADH-FMN oxidoreductase RutF
MAKAGPRMSMDRKGIENLERIRRLNFINSISGYKAANLIGTVSSAGHTNLAIVSSVMHLSSSPAVIGFIQRPTVVPRHTYQNIKDTGWYTINQIHKGITDKAHYTSAKFDESVSEFEQTGLTEHHEKGYPAPFVRESRLRMMVRYIEEYMVKASNTIMVVGGIELVQVDEKAIKPDGAVDHNYLETIAVTGLNSYHEAAQFAAYPYARPGEFPENKWQEP